MDIKELKSDSLNLDLRVTIGVEEFERKVNAELQKVAKNAKMDGFRKGKVPASMLKKKYNLSLRVDVLRDFISMALNSIREERELNIIGEAEVGDVRNQEGKDVEFTLKYDLIPEIKMPDWQKISLERPVLELSEEDIDNYIKGLAASSINFDKETKGKSKKGDQVTLDAVGKVDGEAFEGGKLVGHKLVLGSGVFIEGFEDQLIGSKAGDDVKVEVTFPEKYHATELAGKDAIFECQIKAVHQPVEQKIDDEFAKGCGYSDMADFKNQVKLDITNAYTDHVMTHMKLKLFDQLEDYLAFDAPGKLLEREKQILQQQTADTEEEVDELKGKSKKEKDEYYEKLAARRVKLGLLLAQYIRELNVEITRDDIRNAVFAEAKKFPGQERQVVEYYSKSSDAVEFLKGPILEQKAVEDILANKIKVTDKKYKKDALEKLLDE